MDNAVVVLETKDVIGSEYRVANVDNVDALFGVFDDKTGKWTGDSEIIVESFYQSDVYTDEEAALTYASELAEQSEYLENGIMVLRDFKNMEFNQL